MSEQNEVKQDSQEEQDSSTWACIYPVYVDSTATISEGRRISQEQAVENPTLKEIEEVVKYLGFSYLAEVLALPFHCF